MASAKQTSGKLPRISFRAFLEDPAFCNLELSPTIAAIVDASEGYPVTLSDAECMAVFGCKASALPREARRTVAVSAGGRGGKSSRLLAPKALHAACTVPLPNLRAGEKGRSVIIAPSKDLADQDLDYVRGYAEESPVIRKWLVPDTPKTVVRIRRPDGTVVDIVVGAATRGGKAARGRCLVFCGLDEASFFYTDDGHEVSDKEIYRAAILRVEPGGQVWIVSTPWIEEIGLLEERIKAETDAVSGLRRHESTLVVARVSTRMLNPKWDHSEECRRIGACTRTCGEIERDMRSEDPENAAREIDAIPLAAGTSAFFDPESIRKAFDAPAPAGVRVGVGAGADFGFTSDCTAAAVAARYHGAAGTGSGGDIYDWFDAHERRPSRSDPLKPSEVVGEVAAFVLGNGGKSLVADGHYKETVREFLEARGVQFITAPELAEGKLLVYTAVRKAMGEGRVRISVSDPILRGRIKAQLRSIIKKPLPGGGIQISAPRKRAGPMGGTTHGDLVSAGVLALWKAGAGKVVRTGEPARGIACGSSRYAGVVGRREAGRSDVAEG